jgi:hypothetical protein
VSKTATVYQSSDLNSKYRQILNEAKAAGFARVRDSDGTSLVITLEGKLLEHERELASLTVISNAFADLVRLNMAKVYGRDLGADEVGSWPWVREFDEEDLQEFMAEIRMAALEGFRSKDSSQILRILKDWQTTAETLSDPMSREVLLGATNESNYSEVKRPG